MSDDRNSDTSADLAKYKKLLTLARSNLEANLAALASKDKIIAQLQENLDDKRSKANDECPVTIPRCLVRRVDVNDRIWILIETENGEEHWKDFTDEQNLDDYIQRISGVPLQKPSRCLSPEESTELELSANRKVDRVMEEMHRQRVRYEVARKQKDFEARQAVLRGASSLMPSSSTSSTSNISVSLGRAMSDGAMGDSSYQDELQRIKAQLAEQESKWRLAYEKVVKENEQFRTRGSEAMLATQWRERFESCSREKEDLSEKLKIYGYGGAGSGAGAAEGGDAVASGKPVEQLFVELRDEYKDFKRRVYAKEKQRQLEEELREAQGQGGSGNGSGSGEARHLSSPSYMHSTANGTGAAPSGNWSANRMDEAKIQYVRQMVYQYLTCRDSEVKLHIEAALVAILRFSEQEKLIVELRKRDESQDTISSISSYFGSLASP